ncbi:MAG: hypothetical protein AABY22_29565, partial [Nanoarchaeota archaeon]
MAKTWIFAAGILILAAVGFFVLGQDSGVSTGNAVAEDVNPNNIQGEIQKVVLSQEDLNYKEVVVEAGKPISITADNSVRGCLRSVAFNLDGKRYSKYLQSSNDA